MQSSWRHTASSIQHHACMRVHIPLRLATSNTISILMSRSASSYIWHVHGAVGGASRSVSFFLKKKKKQVCTLLYLGRIIYITRHAPDLYFERTSIQTWDQSGSQFNPIRASLCTHLLLECVTWTTSIWIKFIDIRNFVSLKSWKWNCRVSTKIAESVSKII